MRGRGEEEGMRDEVKRGLGDVEWKIGGGGGGGQED